jgi:hypothetical protein
MLDKRFVSASILEVSANAWKLTFEYSYYNLYSFKDVYVYKSEIYCIHKLVLERCDNDLQITLANGNEKVINVGNG